MTKNFVRPAGDPPAPPPLPKPKADPLDFVGEMNMVCLLARVAADGPDPEPLLRVVEAADSFGPFFDPTVWMSGRQEPRRAAHAPPRLRRLPPGRDQGPRRGRRATDRAMTNLTLLTHYVEVDRLLDQAATAAARRDREAAVSLASTALQRLEVLDELLDALGVA
jgi:hypothetical protein